MPFSTACSLILLRARSGAGRACLLRTRILAFALLIFGSGRHQDAFRLPRCPLKDCGEELLTDIILPVITKLTLELGALSENDKARTILIESIDVVDLRQRIEALEVLRQQAQSGLILLLATCYRRQASLLVNDQQVLILIEDLDLLMRKCLRKGGRMDVDGITGLERRIELRRRLRTDGYEAVVQELLDRRAALIGQRLDEEG